MALARVRLLAALLLGGAVALSACANAPAPPPPEPTVAQDAPTAAAVAPTTADAPAPTAAAAEPTAAAPAAQASDQPYRIGIFSDVTTTNYWSYLGPNGSQWNFYILSPQRVGLYGLSDKRFELIPQVAVEMPARPLEQEGELWVATVKLRDNVTWSDGTPLTAKDYAFTGNTVLQLQLPGNWTGYFDWNYIERIEAPDDTTVKLYYKAEPGIATYEWGALQAPIMQEAYWAPVVEQARAAVGALTPPADSASDEEKAAFEARTVEALNELYNHEPVDEPTAAGWAQGSREPGAFIENSANPDFFQSGAQVSVYANGAYQELGEGYEIAVGDPVSQQIAAYTVGPHTPATVYTVYGSQDAAILALKNGEIDYILNPIGLQSGLRAQVENQPGISVLENPVNGYRYLGFNMRRKPMDSLAFRQAVATLIDKEFVTKNVLQGAAFPMETFIPEANAAWYEPEVSRYGFKDDGAAMTRGERVARAVELLSEAGFTWEAGSPPVYDETAEATTNVSRLVGPDGEPVPDLGLLAPVPSYDPLRSTFAVWVERWLSDIGIPVRSELKNFNVLRDQVVNQQDFDMYILGWSLDIFPSNLHDFFHSERSSLGDLNSGGFSDPEYDAAAEELLSCTTLERCREIAGQLQQTLSGSLPYVVLFDTGIIEAYRGEVLAFPYTDTLSGLQYLAGLPTTVSVQN